MLPVRNPRTLRAQRRVLESRGVPGQRVAGRQVLTQRAGDRVASVSRPVGVVAAGQRQLELELVEPVRARDVAQPQPVDDRPQRRLDRRPQPLRRPDPARRDRAPGARAAPRDALGELRVEVGCGEVGRLEHACGRTCRTSTPTGVAPSGDSRSSSGSATPGRDRHGRRQCSGSSLRTGCSGSLATIGSCASAVMSV